MLYIARSRVSATIRLQNHLLFLADNLWIEAGEANQQQETILVKIHNMIITVATLLPGIAAGVIIASPDSNIRRDELEASKSFLQRNRWAIPYIATNYYIVKRIEFYAAPWDVTRWKDAFVGWFFMLFPSETGVIGRAESVQQVSRQVEEIDRLDAARNCPLIPA
ncbi:MAG: hypothetical protein K8R88_09980 [Armatimonadetes bacterium]|nr:hypothetical protein [Armatimonadota bacterium]